MTKPIIFFDVECYCNFFMAVFKNRATGEIARFQISPNRALNTIGLGDMMRSATLVGFNCNTYDVPMLQLALTGATAEELKRASDDIIVGGMRIYDFAKTYNLRKPDWDVIDLIEVAPLKGSLKLYAGRLHAQHMQDLPIEPSAMIDAASAAQLFAYCKNDLDNTALLYTELETPVKLRTDLSVLYGKDLRSRSDAQVAERILISEIEKLTGVTPTVPHIPVGTVYPYRAPDYVTYKLPQLQEVLARMTGATYVVNDTGHIGIPPELDKLKVKIGTSTYRIGLGGLHSSETREMYEADDSYLLIDRDVASFYPAIILTQRLYPHHLGEAFLTVYQSIVDRRLKAKKAGDKSTAESLKIAINGTFGKLANKWSALYAPDRIIHVCLTGQLALFMLIEAVEGVGIPVISANTDGFLIRCPRTRYEELGQIVSHWETVTGFKTEETQYRSIFIKDVNNYIAIKTDGTTKSKGLYSNPWETPGPNVAKLQKNPSATITIEAVIALLRDGIPLHTTIKGCRDITKFVSIRSVTGGAAKHGDYVGKIVRWYYSTETMQEIMNYKKSGNKVPKSEGSKPLMELPAEFPNDINYDWYIAEANDILLNIGWSTPGLFA